MTSKNRKQPTILLVDDDQENLKMLNAFLGESGFRISMAQSGEEALELAERNSPDIILLDVLMPGMDGFETCRRLKGQESTQQIPVIFLTGLTEIVDKLKGFEAGGVDFITKPVQHEEVLARVNAHLAIRNLQQQLQTQNARLQEKNAQLQAEIAIRKQTEEALEESKEEQNHLRKEVVTLQTTLRDRYKFGDIIGKSQVMQQVYEQIIKAAASETNVLIYGESGTGKELVAQTIHSLSDRKEHAFVPVNCGAVTESIFEREFFGHRKGAFTGADRDRPGYLDKACGGTLFLDEVAELTPSQQVTLLRVLENREYIPVGATTSKHADVRFIFATNKDLKALLQKGDIREDFYYRIRVFVIAVPPLRDRREDIPLLVEHFASIYSKEKPLSAIPGGIIETLSLYHWPGNVRELQNELQRYLAGQPLEFTITLPEDQNDLSFSEAVEIFEKNFITRALQQNENNKTKTAAMLGVDRKTLYAKIKKYGIISV